MNNSFFALIFRQRYIVRWGLMRNIHSENLAEHSAQVAMLAHVMAKIGNKRLGKNYDIEKITVSALYHDATEIYTGDMPTPIKYYNKITRDNYAEIEENAKNQLLSHLPEYLRDDFDDILSEDDEETHRIVKAADKLCAYIKCVEELKCGNSEFSDAAKTTFKALKDYNCPALDIFMEEFLPSFEMTLDELQK